MSFVTTHPAPIIEPKYEVPLSKEQIAIYDKLKNKMMFASAPEEKLKAFSDMHKFSQHPKMIDNKDTDRWWNPAKENQATDRAYRIGQEKEVHVYFLIDVYPDHSEKTFDEKLHDLIMKKIEIASNFLVPNDSEDKIKEELISSIVG